MARKTNAKPTPTRGPGRPTKFGRPSKLVALTIPLDVLATLERLDRDPARAIVALVENGTDPARREAEKSPPNAELVQLTRHAALIVVNTDVVATLPGVSMLPLDAKRAFLALEPGSGLADLELAVQDRLDTPESSEGEREALDEMKHLLRLWRRDPTLRFESRAIIVALRRPGRPRRSAR